MSDNTTNRPLCDAFKVWGEGERAQWTKVGALWPSKSGGFIYVVPDGVAVSGRVVFQPVKDKADGPETPAA